jgi:hypothetical protein
MPKPNIMDAIGPALDDYCKICGRYHGSQEWCGPKAPTESPKTMSHNMLPTVADLLADCSYYVRTGKNEPSAERLEKAAIALRALSAALVKVVPSDVAIAHAALEWKAVHAATSQQF